MVKDLQDSLSVDINRITALAANVLEAHSVIVYMPSDATTLTPLGLHTLAPTAIELKPLNIDTGLIGWVAKNKRSIHVSPFERDSRILGFYKEDLELKSLLGVPVSISESASDRSSICGVLLADSKKSFAFSKIQGKLLEDIGIQVSRTIALHRTEPKQTDLRQDWNRFMSSAEKFASVSGISDVAAVRIRPTNMSSIESRFGLSQASSFLQQVYRLINQALPPHCPTFVSPLGEMVMVIDSMTTDLFTNKILALTEYTKLHGANLEVEFRARAYPRGERNLSLEKLVDLTAFEDKTFSLEQKANFASEPIIEEKRRKILSFR